MMFSADALEAEICKLRGLLQMLHEDQPDVMEDVFQFHLGNLLSHSSIERHGYIRTCADEMLAAVQAMPVAVHRRATRKPDFRLMDAVA